MPVTKAVIPAAGFGTRFLPATKSQPKEMLPIVDTPTIQYVVEECVRSGITEILMVIGERSARSRSTSTATRAGGGTRGEGQDRAARADPQDLRHGRHPLRLAEGAQRARRRRLLRPRPSSGNEPFALLLGDTLLGSDDPERPILRQMLDIFDQHGESVVALEEVPERQGVALRHRRRRQTVGQRRDHSSTS